MTVIDPTRRGLLGALLGLAFGWELIEALSSASPLYTGAPIGGALGEAWPMLRLALHTIACAAAFVSIGQLLNKSYRPLWPAIYGVAGVIVHALGAGLQLAAIRAAQAQGSLQQESVDGLFLAVGTTSLIGCVLPLTVLVLGLKTPRTDEPPPKLPIFAGLVLLVVFGGLGYRAFVAPENALAESLLTGDQDEQLRAAIRLAERGPKSIVALDALSQTLASDDAKLARAAALALKRAAEDGIAPAKRALSATSPTVRLRAIEVLRVIGERAASDAIRSDVADALRPAVADTNAKVQAGAIEGLRRIGAPGKGALVASYTDPKLADAQKILEPILLTLDDKAAAVAVHRRRLSDQDATVRFVAARALMRLAADAEPAASELVGRLVAQDEPQVKSAAASALRAIGRAAHPPIDRALASADAETKALLLYAKGEGEAPTGQSALVPQGVAPLAFLQGLANDNATRPDQVQALAALIADEGEAADLRAAAARALMPLGPKAASAAFVLDKARREFDAKVAQAATEAYLVVAPTKTADVAAELASPYEPRRLITARALRHVSIAHKEVATSLSIALVDEATSVRAAAAESLGELGAAAAHTLSSLQTAKDDTDAFVRAKASEAYDKIVQAQ